MGIINVTLDSFYAHSRKKSLESGISYAQQMIAEGVDIIDIGGESTRPGSFAIDADEELQRVVPLIRGIRSFSSLPLSIDTQKASVAAAAIEDGAMVINDVSAGSFDADMFRVAAQNDVQMVLMHMKGRPQNMQESPSYADVVEEIKEYLYTRIDAALNNGISESNIIIDPGIGFGKRLEDNIAILQNVDAFVDMGFPLLIGLSRKSFLASLLKDAEDPIERLHGSTACHAWCVQKGVAYLRVHDVKACRDCIDVMTTLINE